MKTEIRKVYHANGQLEWETPYENGQRHGVVKWYHANGQLHWETPYVNGQKHGVKKVYEYKGMVRTENHLTSTHYIKELVNKL